MSRTKSLKSYKPKRTKEYNDYLKQEYLKGLRSGLSKPLDTSLANCAGKPVYKGSKLFVLDIPQETDDAIKQRKQKAMEESRQKASQVAPAFSKGAYQFITNPTDLVGAAKKI